MLVHELVHALGIGYADHGREAAEVLTETAAYVVCGSVGLDTSSMSVPYVAGWGESGDLDKIRELGALVDDIARKLEDACEVS
jgi:hypothetical protein